MRMYRLHTDYFKSCIISYMLTRDKVKLNDVGLREFVWKFFRHKFDDIDSTFDDLYRQGILSLHAGDEYYISSDVKFVIEHAIEESRVPDWA